MLHISKALGPSKQNYIVAEKTVFMILDVAQRLHYYFTSLNNPICGISSRPNVAGWVTKWAITLAEYDFEYVNKKSLKG